jgi:hypothetical protein
MPIPSTVPVSNPLAPTSELDTFATHNEHWGLGGYRSVADATQRDAITHQRRKAGMLVQTLDDGVIWMLGADLSTWTRLPFDWLIRADLAERDAIPSTARRVGLHVYVIATSSVWILGPGLTNGDWNEVPSAAAAEAAAARASLISLSHYELYDDFERANVPAGGNLGAPLTGGDPWEVKGWGGSAPSPYVYLESGALRLSRTSDQGVAYLVRDFGYKPTIMGAEIVFENTDTPGGPARAMFCMSVTTKENGTWIDNLVHCLISEYQLVIQTGFWGGQLITHAYYSFNAGTIVRGRKYRVELIFDGPLAILRLDRFYCVANDPRISRNHGKFGYWEWYNEMPDSGNRVAIHSVWAKRIATAPAREPIRTGFQPHRRSYGLRFTGHPDRATANLSGLTSIGTGDFSVWWRGRLPQNLLEVNLVPTKIMGLWALNAQSGGQDWGNGPRLILEHSVDWNPTLRFRIPNGAEYRDKVTHEDYPGQSLGKTLDLLVLRKGGAVEMYGDGLYLNTWPDQVSANPPAWTQSISSAYLHVGHCDSQYDRGFRGEVYECALANLALPGEDHAQLLRGVIPERLKWATNTPLPNGGSLFVGKCYRLGVVGTADYWYTGCAQGDEIWVIKAPVSQDGQAINLKSGALHTLKTLTTNASNTATQIGFLCFLTGTEGDTVMRDLSDNRCDAVLNGSIYNAAPGTDLVRGLVSLPVADAEDHRTLGRGLFVSAADGKSTHLVVASGTRALGVIVDGGVGASVAPARPDRLLLCNSGAVVKLRTAAAAGTIVAGTPLSIDYGTAISGSVVGAVRAASYGQVIVAVALEAAGNNSWVSACLIGQPPAGPQPPSYPVYWGKSANATIDYATVFGTFSTRNQPSAAGNFDFVTGPGYAYLVFREDWTSPTSLKIGQFDLSLASAAPYNITFGSLTHATLNLSGVIHRVFRSDQQLNGDFTVTAA